MERNVRSGERNVKSVERNVQSVERHVKSVKQVHYSEIQFWEGGYELRNME